jgi:hypothetical protein
MSAFPTVEDLFDDNDQLQALAYDALSALNECRLTDLRTILERMADPKWGSTWHCKEQYELEMGR